MTESSNRENHPRHEELRERFKFRVTLMDYETGKELDSASINMPYFGAGYLVPKEPLNEVMACHAARLARNFVHGWLKKESE